MGRNLDRCIERRPGARPELQAQLFEVLDLAPRPDQRGGRTNLSLAPCPNRHGAELAGARRRGVERPLLLLSDWDLCVGEGDEAKPRREQLLVQSASSAPVMIQLHGDA